MCRSITALILIASICGWAVPARSYTLQYTDASASVQIKWPTSTILIALSSSLSAPSANIKAGSDVLGAVHRALAHWSEAVNIHFIETPSSAQSISIGSGDGISLITVADTPQNRSLFTGGVRQGRTRVFFDAVTGHINEADIAINPTIFAADDGPGFSTDGTPGTYDLESTLTHEIGHLLGLEHSAVVGATMQPCQGINGLYNLPAVTTRTLADDDRAGVRALYGARAGTGAIAGRVRNAAGSVYGAHVWAENASTGRVSAGSVTLSNGAYRIENLPPGAYRVVVEYLNEPVAAAEIGSSRGAYAGLAGAQPRFQTAEVSHQVRVTADTTTSLSLLFKKTPPPTLNPRLLGLEQILSTIAVPLAPGSTYTIFVGGEGLDQVAGSGVTITSPFFSVNQASLSHHEFGDMPVLSFDVTVSANAPPGEYSIRLASKANEVAYIAGCLTIDSSNSGPRQSE